MKYTHRFRVRAPLDAVAEFHSGSASMAAITPPPIRVRFEAAPHRVREGDRIAFALQVGPVRIPWVACISQLSHEGFTDTQERGPFARWRHRHAFVIVGPELTEVIDEIDATLRPHPWWGIVGAAMWLGMPLLFAYRGWKTRRLLEKGL